MEIHGYDITEEQIQKVADITWYTMDEVYAIFNVYEKEAINAYKKILSDDLTWKTLFTELLATNKKYLDMWKISTDIKKKNQNFPYEISFLEKVYEWSIEVTENEIIYHAAGIAIAREQFTYKIPSKAEKFDSNEDSLWASCSLPLSNDRYAANVSQCMADSQKQLQSPYVLMDESHMELLLSAYRSWEENPYYLFAPFGKNIILSSEVQQKKVRIDWYHTDYRQKTCLIQVLSYSSYYRQKIDEWEGFTWCFLAVRML